MGVLLNFFQRSTQEDHPLVEAKKDHSFELFVGENAHATLSQYVKEEFPERDYHFHELKTPIALDPAFEVGSNSSIVVPIEEGSPYVRSDHSGVIVLMKSSTHLGVACVHHDIKPFKEALMQMTQNSSPSEVELFIVGGKGKDTPVHDAICSFTQSVNKKTRAGITFSDDLFKMMDFQGFPGGKTPTIQFAGFDQNIKPITLIEYIDPHQQDESKLFKNKLSF